MREEMIVKQITEFIVARGASIIHLKYYRKIFGNIELLTEHNSQTFEIVTDRGEIYCNKNLVCDNSYHVSGMNDTIGKLLEVVASVLN